ncbi:hypothetical protein [Streptomyces huasconensis]|uniref:hypothetical protein n=1 Tax=Streptomyces huasconensis TaxID=1854574 RepID=UPI0036F83703
MTARLSPQREAEIDGRAAHLYEYSTSHNAEWDELAGEDVPALLAELAAVRAELDQAQAELAKYVGKEPTVVEEMAYLNSCLNAAFDVCDQAEKQAKRWEQPLPVPGWVEVVRSAATGGAS